MPEQSFEIHGVSKKIFTMVLLYSRIEDRLADRASGPLGGSTGYYFLAAGVPLNRLEVQSLLTVTSIL
jgi:hypothetical protein